MRSAMKVTELKTESIFLQITPKKVYYKLTSKDYHNI